jgi:CBS domain-containing protein
LTREVSTRHSLDTKAFEMMSPNVVTAGEDETAAELAARMLEQRIHRILVTSGGEVTGVITSFDLLRAVVEYESHLVEGSR